MRGQILVFLFCLCPLASAAPKPSVDFVKLRQVCESSWAEYRSQLGKVQQAAHEWTVDMTQTQIETLYDANDQLMIFITAFFPSELGDRLTGAPQSFEDVFTLNTNLQRDMSDRSLSHVEEVTQFTNSLMSRYSNGTQLLAPLNQIVACYKKQATQFKP